MESKKGISTQFIVLEPITATFRSALDALKGQRDAKNVELLFVSNASEATQVTFQYSPCIVAFSIETIDQVPTALAFLKTISAKIEAKEIKVLAVNKLNNEKVNRALEQLKLSVVVTEPIAARTLMFKLLLQIKAIDTIRKTNEMKRKANEKIAIKSSGDQNANDDDAVNLSWKESSNGAAGKEKFVLNGNTPAAATADKKISEGDETRDTWQRAKTDKINGGSDATVRGEEASVENRTGSKPAEAAATVIEANEFENTQASTLSSTLRRRAAEAKEKREKAAEEAKREASAAVAIKAETAAELISTADSEHRKVVTAAVPASEPAVDAEMAALDELIKKAREKARARKAARAQAGAKDDPAEEAKEQAALAQLETKVAQIKSKVQARAKVSASEPTAPIATEKESPGERSKLATDNVRVGSKASASREGEKPAEEVAAEREQLEKRAKHATKEEKSSPLAPAQEKAQVRVATKATAESEANRSSPAKEVKPRSGEEIKPRTPPAASTDAEKVLSPSERLAAIRRKRIDKRNAESAGIEFDEEVASTEPGARASTEGDSSSDEEGPSSRGRSRKAKKSESEEEDTDRSSNSVSAASPALNDAAANVLETLRRKQKKKRAAKAESADEDFGSFEVGDLRDEGPEKVSADLENLDRANESNGIRNLVGDSQEERVKWAASSEAQPAVKASEEPAEELVVKKLKAKITPDTGNWTRVADFFLYVPDRLVKTRVDSVEEMLPLCIYEGSGKPKSLGKYWIFSSSKVEVYLEAETIPAPVLTFLQKFLRGEEEADEQPESANGEPLKPARKLSEGLLQEMSRLREISLASQRRQQKRENLQAAEADWDSDARENDEREEESGRVRAARESSAEEGGVTTTDEFEANEGIAIKKKSRKTEGEEIAAAEFEAELLADEEENERGSVSSRAGGEQSERSEAKDNQAERRGSGATDEVGEPQSASRSADSSAEAETTSGKRGRKIAANESSDPETAAADGGAVEGKAREQGANQEFHEENEPDLEAREESDSSTAEEQGAGSSKKRKRKGADPAEVDPAAKDEPASRAETPLEKFLANRAKRKAKEKESKEAEEKSAISEEIDSADLSPEEKLRRALSPAAAEVAGEKSELESVEEVSAQEKSHAESSSREENAAESAEKRRAENSKEEEEKSSPRESRARGSSGSAEGERSLTGSELLVSAASEAEGAQEESAEGSSSPALSLGEAAQILDPALSPEALVGLAVEEKTELASLTALSAALAACGPAMDSVGDLSNNALTGLGPVGTRAEQMARSLLDGTAKPRRSRGEEMAGRLGASRAVASEEQQLRALYAMATQIQSELPEMQVALVAAEASGALTVLSGGKRFTELAELFSAGGLCWTTLPRIGSARRRVGVVVYPCRAGTPLSSEALAYLAKVAKSGRDFLSAA